MHNIDQVLLSNKNSESNFERTILAYHNINRFLGAFIDHVKIYVIIIMLLLIYNKFQALNDLDYIVKERSIIETVFDCELTNNLTDSKAII